MSKQIKILFLADTHLGFDYPIKPRIKRRRRGEDFFQNYHKALKPALEQKVDAVIHGGDLFFRSKVHHSIITKAFEPLKHIAELGIPVYIVPGNHERSFIPGSLFDRHENIKIFDTPTTFIFQKHDRTILLAGFPFIKGDIRGAFGAVLEKTNWQNTEADAKILCMHQCIEGAQVGAQNYTFRNSEDVINTNDIPGDFDAVLSGHIHRWQILQSQKQNGKTIPIIYPGSIERTSFAERLEEKGYLILDIILNEKQAQINTTFHNLNARPMLELIITKEKLKQSTIEEIIKKETNSLDKNSIIRLTIEAEDQHITLPSIEQIRALVPHTMNIDYRLPQNPNRNY